MATSAIPSTAPYPLALSSADWRVRPNAPSQSRMANVARTSSSLYASTRSRSASFASGSARYDFHQVIDWLKEMVGFDPAGTGVLLSGGSFANFAGLAVALRASTAIDLNRLGVGALPGQPRIYTSTMTHMSIGKAG